MINKKRFAFYLRSATGDLADLNCQFKILEDEVTRQGFSSETSTVELYQDTHQSGLRSGPELERMTNDVKLGKVDIVMVSRLNRVSRALGGQFSFYECAKNHPIRFLSIEEKIDSDQWHFQQRPTVESPQFFISALSNPYQRKEQHR
jgi:DNA invertase Pin-like site-specific DNA recombinase